MTFSQINYFLTLAACLNYTEAATKLFISQSALSRSIASLEKELDVKLLIRNYHSVELTKAGKILYREMNEIMENIDEVLNRVTEADKKSGSFIIGVLDGQSVASSVLYGLNKMADIYPTVKLELRRFRHSEFVAGIRKGQIDLAQTIISENTVLDEVLEKMIIGREPYYLTARANLPLWEEEQGLAMLNNTTLLVQRDISPDVPDITRTVKGACPNVKIKYTQDEGTRSLWLESGLGATICNQNHIFLASKTRPLKWVRIPELGVASIALIWNRNNCSPLLDAFLKIVSDSEKLMKESINGFTSCDSESDMLLR